MLKTCLFDLNYNFLFGHVDITISSLGDKCAGRHQCDYADEDRHKNVQRNDGIELLDVL